MSNLVDISPVVLEKKIFFDTVFSLFRYYIILEQGGALHLNSIVLIEIDPGVLDKKIFKFCQSFVIIFPWEKGGALNLNKLESHSPLNAWTKFGWNRACGSGEEKNVKS